MDAASLLVALALTGQAGWTPERTAAPPPAAAPEFDRYAQPAATATGVSPPPGMMDRAQTAVSESTAAMRDGFDAGVSSANQQLQSWANSAGQQIQATGDSIRTAAERSLLGTPGGSPVTSTQSTAPASASSRGGVAPPPWSIPAGLDVEPLSSGTPQSVPLAGPQTAPLLQPVATNSGWTSIGSQTPAPRLLVPALSSTPSSVRPLASSAPASDGSSWSGPALTGGAPQATAGAESWSNDWNNQPSPPLATIGQSGQPAPRESGFGNPQFPSGNSQPPPAQPPAASSWADLWGDDDPWKDTNQTTVPAVTAGQTAPAGTRPTTTTLPEPPPVLAGAANQFGNTQPIGHVSVQPTPVVPELGSPTTRAATGNDPPWIPLLLVSLSLAGSLGANLFLGWSYLEARQRYSTLVRKTADKFRRAAAAA